MLITLIVIDVGYELQARSREEGTSYKLAPAEGKVNSEKWIVKGVFHYSLFVIHSLEL